MRGPVARLTLLASLLMGCATGPRLTGPSGFDPNPLPSKLDLSDVLDTDRDSGIEGWTWLMWRGDERNVTVIIHCACLPGDIAMRPDEGGYFRLTGIPRGWYTVEFVRRGDERGDWEKLGLIGGDGELHRSWTGTLPTAHADLAEGAERTTWVGGTLNLDHHPLPGVWLSLDVPGIGGVELITDEQGRFSARLPVEEAPPRYPGRGITLDVLHRGWNGDYRLRREHWATINLYASKWAPKRETITRRERWPTKSMFYYRDPLGGPLVSFALP